MFDSRCSKRPKLEQIVQAPDVHSGDISNRMGDSDFKVDRLFLAHQADRELERNRKIDEANDALFEEQAKDLLEKQKKREKGRNTSFTCSGKVERTRCHCD